MQVVRKDTTLCANLVPRVLSLPLSREEERGPWNEVDCARDVTSSISSLKIRHWDPGCGVVKFYEWSIPYFPLENSPKKIRALIGLKIVFL